eukprot:m.78435 g.78435  ORF g.78435 m.78435 type:complete len:1476 (+) comp12535_c0_seq1:189-4616(+)
MEERVTQLATADSRDKPAIAEKLITDIHTSSEVPERIVGAIVNELLPWLKASNFKVGLSAVTVLAAVNECSAENLHHHVDSLLPILLEKLGDTKEEVRDATQTLVLDMMETATTPQHVMDQLAPALKHRNWRLRKSALNCFEETLGKYGSSAVMISKLLKDMVLLLGDRNEHVRNSASNAILQAYRHVGSRIRADIRKMKDAPQSKLPALFERFDAMDASGTMIGPVTPVAGDEDDADDAGAQAKPFLRRDSRRSTRGSAASLTGAASFSGVQSRISTSVDSRGSGGGISQEQFEEMLDDTVPLPLGSDRDVEQELKRLKGVLGDTGGDWTQRAEALKAMRSIVVGGAPSSSTFVPTLKQMNDAMNANISDLRSGIVKEVCLTIAAISNALGNAFAPFFNAYLEELVKQANVNIRIIADSAREATMFVLRHTYFSKLFSRLDDWKGSKSVTQRRFVAQCYTAALTHWDKQSLQRHVKSISAYLSTGMTEADSVVRATNRRNYWHFHAHFPSDAASVLSKLPSSAQRHVEEERVKMESGAPIASVSAPPRSKVRKSVKASTSSSAPGSRTPSRPSSSHHQKPSASAASRSTPNSPRRQRRHTTIAGAGRSTTLDDRRARSSTLTSKGSSSFRTSDETDKAKASTLTSSSRRSARGGTGSLYRTSSERNISRSGASSGTTSSSSLPPPSSTMSFSNPGTMSRRQQSSAKLSAPKRVPAGPKTPGADRGSVKSRIPRTPTSSSRASMSRLMSRSTTDIRSLHASPSSPFSSGDPLTDILVLSKSGDWADRLQALENLQTFIHTETPTSRQTNKICRFFAKAVDDGHNKVLSLVLATLNTFMVIHRSGLPAGWLRDIIPALLLRLGANLVPTIRDQVLAALETLRQSFPIADQLTNLFKFVQSERTPHNTLVKLASISFLYMLMEHVSPFHLKEVHTQSPSEYRGAFRTLMQFASEPKSYDLRHYSSEVIIRLFHTHPPLFARVMAALPVAESDVARNILTLHIPDWTQLIEQEVDETDPAAYDNDGFAGDVDATLINATVATLSPTKAPHSAGSIASQLDDAAHDGTETDTHAHGHEHVPDILTLDAEVGQTSDSEAADDPTLHVPAGRLDYDSTSQTESITSSATSVEVRTALASVGISSSTHGNGNGNGGFKSYDPLTYANRGAVARGDDDDVSDDVASATSSIVDARSAASDPLHSGLSFEERLARRREEYSAKVQKRSQSSASAEESQNGREPSRSSSQKVEEALDTLKASPETSTTNTTLQWLATIAKDGSSDIWEEHCDSVLQVLLDLFADPEPSVREQALRVLREMLRNHCGVVFEYIDTILPRLFQLHMDEESSVLRAVNEAIVLIQRSISYDVFVDVLLPFLPSPTSNVPTPVLLAALRAFDKVIAVAEPNQIVPRLSDVMPSLCLGYKHQAAEIRKTVVACLVALHLKTGANAMEIHLQNLNDSQIKLFEIYLRRAKKKAEEAQESSA